MPAQTNLNDKRAKLHAAVIAYSEKTGINGATIAEITEKAIDLLAARWEHICDVANDEESDGKAKVSLSIALDFTAKCPAGALTLAFSVRTKEETSFAVDDPEQPRLPFNRSLNERTSTAVAPGAPLADTPAQPTAEQLATNVRENALDAVRSSRRRRAAADRAAATPA